MRIFVAGATGYTGTALVAEALARGHTVTAHVRPGSPGGDAAAARFAAAGATVSRAPWDPAAITEALADARPTAVFALLGTTRARGAAAARDGRTETYATVDRDLTLLLHAAAATLALPPVFVYLSSMGADRPGANAYLQARAAVEQGLAQSPLPQVIARPSFITGPDRAEPRPAERWGAAVADVALGAVGAFGARAFADRYRSIRAAELARGLLRAAAAAEGSAGGRVVLDSAGLRDNAAQSSHSSLSS
jgi:uncharacterized protein YbjT (DUF2867 family)